MTEDKDLRDHFQRLYATGGPDADRALAVLELLDRVETAEQELAGVEERIGDVAKAAERLVAFESLEAWAEANELVSAEPGETLEEQLTRIIARYEEYERQSFDLVELCASAGLIGPRDHETDLIPLIRMFLPIEED